MPNFINNFLPSSWFLLTVLLMVVLATFLFAKVAQWFAADSDLRMNPRLVKAGKWAVKTLEFLGEQCLQRSFEAFNLSAGSKFEVQTANNFG